MDRAGVDARNPDRLLAARRDQDCVPQPCELFLNHHAQAGLVFHYEDGFLSALKNATPGSLRRYGQLIDGWKVNLESAPLSGLAVYPDVSIVLLHNVVNRRRPQFRPGTLRHSMARVGDSD